MQLGSSETISVRTGPDEELEDFQQQRAFDTTTVAAIDSLKNPCLPFD